MTPSHKSNTGPLVQALDRLARLLPEIAGRQAFIRFCTPSLSSARAVDHDRLVERARFHLRGATAKRLSTSVGNLQTYILEPDGTALGTILLVHGWTGEAAFMSAFGDYLRRRGWRCVLFDMPAHGLSSGRVTSLIDCAHSVREVVEALGPVRGAIGHSIGGLALLTAVEGRRPMRGSCPLGACVLVAAPDRFCDVTRAFAAEIGLSEAGLGAFERRLEHLAERGVADFTASALLAAAGNPALLLHSRDDPQVPFEDARRIAASVEGVELEAFDGLGHRMILYAPPAVRAAAAFLRRHLT